MFPQDCNESWLSLLSVAFHARSTLACLSSDGRSAASETSAAAVAIMSMVASILQDMGGSMARLENWLWFLCLLKANDSTLNDHACAAAVSVPRKLWLRSSLKAARMFD
jgi:hypothetical protein